MSFFKDIKDDLEQAVNDIGTGAQKTDDEDLFSMAEGLGGDISAADIDPELLASILEDGPQAAPAPKPEPASMPKPEPVVEKPVEKPVEAARVPETPVPEQQAAPVRPAAAPAAQAKPAEPLAEEKKPQKEPVDASVTVITKGTTINGSIISDCSLDVMGTINGDIECLGKLTISGKVSGNSTASEVFVNTERLEGSITSEGSVKIGLGTVVIGDINANSAVFAGAVKGEIDVKGTVVLDSTAIIKGNIRAKSVQMNSGAIMEGFCSLSYADLEIDSIFD